MSHIKLPPSLGNAKVDVFTRTEGADLVAMQAMVMVDPTDGRDVSSMLDIAGSSISALNGDLCTLTVGALKYLVVQLTGTWAGTVTFQGSNDNATWLSVPGLSSSVGYATTATANGMWVIPLTFKYFRARVTAYTSGTVVPFVVASANAFLPPPSLVSINASSNLIGDVSPGVRTTSTNAASRAKVISAASTNATSVKASAGRVYGYQFSNTTASFKFVKLYNKASAPTVGTDSPVETIAIPPNNSVAHMVPFGVSYATGIAYAITGAYADADTTAVAAGDVIGSLIYA